MKKLLLILWIILCVTSFKSTQANTVANDTIAKINFTVDNSLSAPGWDNVFGEISSPVTINNGIIITISGSPFKSGPSGEPNTVLPAKVGSTYNFLASSNNDPVILAFAGLDPVAKYTFAIFSSRAAAGTS